MHAPASGRPGEHPLPTDYSAALVVDGRGSVLQYTPDALQALGCPPEGVLSLSIGGLLPASDGRTTHGLWTDDVSGRWQEVPYVVLPLVASDPSPQVARWLVVLASAEPAGELERARRQLSLSRGAAVRIGASLDVVRTAETLAEVLVPDFADLVTVDLVEEVLVGDEPPQLAHGGDIRLRRVAAAPNGGAGLGAVVRVGEAIPPIPDSAITRRLMHGEPVTVPDMDALRTALGLDEEQARVLIPEGARSTVAISLYARGLVLGTATLWRTRLTTAFDDDDAALLTEVVSRAALSVDNARRYTREHRSAVALQRSLLPGSVSRTPGAETAGAYLPAGAGIGVGGDWFDAIPLSSLRVAFVVGDVVGHGLGATAAMARLRTAVQALADLDLDPEELLAHLDDLMLMFSTEHDPQDPAAELAVLGATCLYAVYDPVTRRCTIASAGHLPPAVVRPGEAPLFVDLAPGPPLGIGGMPFEPVEIELPEGSLLAFYTDGLVGRRDEDIEEGMARLRERLADCATTDRPLDEVNREVREGLLPASRADDVALLLARTKCVPPESVAEWEFAADLSLVAQARRLACRQLAEWELDELAFTTELVVSELVTNAIRYAGGPVRLRLIRSEVLVCEVSDPSNTQPRLRRARSTDEGGRGLFLVAQLATRWGSRYARSGKTIWTEQPLGAPG
ncbi:SpoIIE family protein phosphatase [Streptomyces sp. A3M-1-3]|uniref:ATP-binding SpoIIE family protein phosphatase n=1 Tax=Streptomyces sp. A3M-1-3 TaxID=2962044 RepID=UPI0020B6F891|nr:SpoIIE family protein phosphatase [Streptomyces sp. A3M-1-3]MCP3818498.1 SpoIIE family protein phosphatase [Streptomyces sp. A3M-1-3]